MQQVHVSLNTNTWRKSINNIIMELVGNDNKNNMDKKYWKENW